jgi:hypothetical protein
VVYSLLSSRNRSLLFTDLETELAEVQPINKRGVGVSEQLAMRLVCFSWFIFRIFR